MNFNVALRADTRRRKIAGIARTNGESDGESDARTPRGGLSGSCAAPGLRDQMGIGSIAPGRRAVFLDRDGVLNRAIVRDGKPYPPNSVDALEILPGVPDALADLKAAGFLLLVITNQPDVAKGIQSREAVEAIHRRLRAELPLDDILVCYHQDEDACHCRKPAPGLLQEAAARHALYLPFCFMVGDRWRDVDAGCRAGCRTILLDYGYREQLPENEPAARVSSLREAADWILACATL